MKRIILALLFGSNLISIQSIAQNCARFDIVIVCHHKDYETLPLCIESIQKFISNQNRIFVIGDKEIKNNSFTFIHENAFYKYVNPFKLQKQWQKINKNLKNRAFWIFQQFLKLGAFLIIEDLSENYLCIDADVIWVRSQKFMNEKGQFLISKNKDCSCNGCTYGIHKPYVETMKKLFNDSKLIVAPFSFICHHAVINQQIVKDMFLFLERAHQKAWYEAVLACIDYNEISSFSEYNLYGNWLWKYHPELLCYRQLKWIDSTDIARDIDNNTVDFVASHWFMNNQSHEMGYPNT